MNAITFQMHFIYSKIKKTKKNWIISLLNSVKVWVELGRNHKNPTLTEFYLECHFQIFGVVIGGGEILVNIARPICSNRQMESTQALANKSVPFHQHAHLLKPLVLLADLVQDIKIKATVAVLTGTSTNMRASVGWHHQKVNGGLWQEIS